MRKSLKENFANMSLMSLENVLSNKGRCSFLVDLLTLKSIILDRKTFGVFTTCYTKGEGSMFGLVPFRRAGGEVGKRLDSLDRMVDQFFDEPWGPLQGIRSGFRVDVKETDAAYLLEADLPGVKKEEISLTYDEHYLTISARRGEEKETKEENYVRREGHAGQVQRSFFIRDVDATKIEAAFEEGVLKVTLPKLSPTPTNKQIEIR